MTLHDTAVQDLIENYVAQLQASGAISSEAVARAFSRIRRDQLLQHVFLPDPNGKYAARGQRYTRWLVTPEDTNILILIYSPSPTGLLVKLDPPSSSTSPGLCAQMLEHLNLKPGMRVLEIGTGTGYTAALIAEMVEDAELVTSIEIQPDIYHMAQAGLRRIGYGEIDLICADAAWGAPGRGLFDRVVATTGCASISTRWIDQLAPGGFMLIPLAHGGGTTCPLMRVRKDGDRTVATVVGWWGFSAMRGALHVDGLWNDAAPDQPPPGVAPQQLPALNPGWSSDSLIPLLDFFYFLVLEDRRCLHTQLGIGLWNAGGVVVIPRDTPTRVLLYGDRKLYEDLRGHYGEYLAIGEPRAGDFRSEFVAAASSPQPQTGLRDTSSPRWVIKRGSLDQVVSLATRDTIREE